MTMVPYGAIIYDSRKTCFFSAIVNHAPNAMNLSGHAVFFVL